MGQGRRTRGSAYASTGRTLLLVGLGMLALGLLAGASYFRGESCSVALLPLAALFPFYAPAIVAGLILLLVGWRRGRRSALAADSVTGQEVAPGSEAADDGGGRGGVGQLLLYVGGATLLLYGGLGMLWSLWMLAAGWANTPGRSLGGMVVGLAWSVMTAGAGAGMILWARRVGGRRAA